MPPRSRDDLIAEGEIPTEGVDPNLLGYWLHKERMRDKTYRFVLDICAFAITVGGLILIGLGHSASDVRSIIGLPVAALGGSRGVVRLRGRRRAG